MKTVLWLGGWASEFQVLEPYLRSLLPDAEWTAIDPHRVAKDPAYLEHALDFLSSTSSPCLLLAWSLGSLQILRALQNRGEEFSFPVLCLNPIDALVGEKAPWAPRVLQRMRRRLKEAPETTLREFWKLATQEMANLNSQTILGFEISLSEKAWLQGALAMGIDQLDAGLADFQTGQSPWQQKDPQGKSLWLLGDPADSVFPFDVQHWRAQWPAAQVRTFSSGHFFFRFPLDPVKAVIEEITSRIEPRK